jgi:hypothetical protein
MHAAVLYGTLVKSTKVKETILNFFPTLKGQLRNFLELFFSSENQKEERIKNKRTKFQLLGPLSEDRFPCLSSVWSRDMRPRLRPEKRPERTSRTTIRIPISQIGSRREYTSSCKHKKNGTCCLNKLVFFSVSLARS